jgi:hypothetical protein
MRFQKLEILEAITLIPLIAYAGYFFAVVRDLLLGALMTLAIFVCYIVFKVGPRFSRAGTERQDTISRIALVWMMILLIGVSLSSSQYMEYYLLIVPAPILIMIVWAFLTESRT